MSLALCLLVLVGAAHAQGGDTATADRLFREGRALMKEGNYEEACSKLEESHRLDPAPGTAINLGDCFDNLGKVASALLAYQAARKLLQTNDPRLAPVRQQISLLEKRVPRLLIRLARGSPPATSVTRDGRKAEPDSRVPVNPGKHVIVVTAPGRETARYSVTLAEAESRTMMVEAGEREGPTETPPSHHANTSGDAPNEQSTGGSTQRTLGFVVGGIGAVALSVAAVYWSKAEDTEATACPPGCEDLENKERDQRTTANWSGGLGLAALAGGIVLVLTAPSADRASARLRVAPRMMYGGAGAQIGGVW